MPRPDNIIDIDLDNLEKEWLDQAPRMQSACRKVSRMKKKMANAKAHLELVQARLDLKVRGNPKKYGLKKVTEPGIKNTVITLDEFQRATKALIQAKFMVDMAEATVSGLEHRKKALEEEVQLWSQSYFSTPRLKKGTEGHVRDRIQTEIARKRFRHGDR
jgi:3-deoxy-D-arabino-heptulosonate 7-phosphate (DAHP) synthase